MEITNNFLSITMYNSREIVPPNGTTDDLDQYDTINPAQSNARNISDPDEINNVQQMHYADIKAAIYNRSHPTVTDVTTSYGQKFDDICASLGISPNTTITKADLTKMTRNDTLEDANKDFCGALNRAFSFLSPTDTISYKDAMLFFMRGAGNDGDLSWTDYVGVVNNYAKIVQNQYEACSTTQEKLEFAIQKTRDYLIESRMDLQLAALDRLTTEPCASQNVPNPDTTQYPNAKAQNANVGQIAFADLGDYRTLENGNKVITKGSYQYFQWNQMTVDKSSVSMWLKDNDQASGSTWADCGITLNSTYYFNEDKPVKWYVLVETLVHELTHATAYYYYNGRKFSQQGLDFMISKGFINSGEYSTTDTNNGDLLYMVQTMKDEWAAYTTSANYWDSIAGDVWNSSQSLAKDGDQEREAIRAHLKNTGYDTFNADGTVISQRPQPEYKNWDWDTFNNMFYFA